MSMELREKIKCNWCKGENTNLVKKFLWSNYSKHFCYDCKEYFLVKGE